MYLKLKNSIKIFLCIVLALGVFFSFSACQQKNNTSGISVYMPDGAPALSMAKLMLDNEKSSGVVYSVVDATTIQTYVTGNNPQADICILPINLASKLLGSGNTYKMLGTVTHGNLFLLSENKEQNITEQNILILKGKTVGIVNLVAVPGLTYKIVLKQYGLEYNELTNIGEVSGDKVNLKNVTPTTLLGCDYYVVAEPAASTMVAKTNLNFVGNIQTLYSEDNGYPQAVVVAKNSLIESNKKFVDNFIEKLSESCNWLLTDSAKNGDIISVIESHLTQGLKPTFSAANLTKEVIKNCAVKFVASSICKGEVDGFIEKIILLNSTSAAKVGNFYYLGN